MNHLAAETSPYLRQHADNPVDWYPWGPEAFDRARREERPVFLSIGYSSCHWCHVMAHESFEDPEVAAELNAAFVAVKVDREERPDVDAVYMEAVQAVTGSGGWPMSVFLLPDGRPFYGGTYFPREDRPGLPSFRTVFTTLAGAWATRRDEVTAQADELADVVARRTTLVADPGAPSLLGKLAGPERPDLGQALVDDLRPRFDPTYGGFGTAPKFPQPSLLDALLRTARRGGPAAAEARTMALTTLAGLAAGGIHDHLRGGFARYSTDRTWLVPHFEKMLYDQAGLLRCFAHAYRLTADPTHLQTMEGIVGYVTSDLRLPAGGLASAEDADSEGGEGVFATWTVEEVTDVAGRAGLDGSEAAALCAFYGVVPGGNFEGRSVLHRPLGEPVRPPADGPLDRGRLALVRARARRPRPGLDDKVLTEWNAMFAAALLEAAGAGGHPAWVETATGVMEFLLGNLRRDDGRWLRSWQAEGGARHLAYAADYAWVVDACTRLAEATGRARWLDEAVAAADGLCDLFLADDGGGFHTTGSDAETLIVRTKDVLDGATPSANAVAAVALVRLAALTGRGRYRDVAAGVVDLLGELVVRHPSAFPLAEHAATLVVRGPTEIVVTGERPDLLAAVDDAWHPDAVLTHGEPTASPLWEGRVPAPGEAGRAYVCRRGTCRLPADDPAALVAELEAVGA